jgi:hypothetical protein
MEWVQKINNVSSKANSKRYLRFTAKMVRFKHLKYNFKGKVQTFAFNILKISELTKYNTPV